MLSRDPSNLFAALGAELTRYIQQQQSQIEREVLTFPPSRTDQLGHVLFSNLTNGGFCTLVVTGRRSWNPQSHYYQSARLAAKRGCKIERAFLLPHKHCRHDPTFQEHINLDRAAGIEVKALYIGELISTLALPLADSLEFGIWDGAVGCMANYGTGGIPGGISEWRVSQRPEDIQVLNDIENILRQQAPPLENDALAPDLEEPMMVTASIAQELAGVLCQGDHVSSEDCSWYHSIWQYLRIFNMVSTPTWHTQFYLNRLESLASQGKEFQRVLISGTADYSMLAHVLWAYNRCQCVPDITVIDLCETPLFLCKWYGKACGVRINGSAADVLKFETSQPFDVVTTDAFLTRFSPEERPTVLSNWHRLLRAGGRIVTTVRIERGQIGKMTRATPEQADAFRRRALQEAMRWQGFLGRSPEELANQAQRYAERMISHSLNSENDVRALFIGAGFDIEHMALVDVPGEMASTLYAEIVACRR